jgi:hypothetical protein
VKPRWVQYKLGETIEQPCSDVLPQTPEVCNGAHLYNGYRTSKDDHDSLGMCNTVITAVLAVMSDMDPHMISGNLGWVGLDGSVEVILLVRSILRSGLCGVIDDLFLGS